MPDYNEDAWLPIGEVLPDVEIMVLPEGVEPLYAFALIKTRSADGTEGWSFRSPDGFNPEELLGALVSQTDWLRKHLLDEWDK